MGSRLMARLSAVSSTLIILALVGCGPGAGAAADAALEHAVTQITAEGIRAHVGVLSHDSMRGRDTNDIGFERARDYVGREFRRIGLEPIVQDSYLQPVDLLEVMSDDGSLLTVGDHVLRFPEVLLAPDWLGEEPVTSAEGVFVGHDLVTGETGNGVLDALGDKIALVLAGAPEGRADEPAVAMRERAMVELAQRRGALAVVVLNPDMDDGAWAARATPRRPTRVLSDGSTPSPRPAAQVGPAASRRLLEAWAAGNIGTVTLEPKHRMRSVRSWNVGGMLPGTDSSRASEVVVFTAHLDHVGIGPPDSTGDSIYNGAHDNALGVAKMLVAAEALTSMALGRSVLFLATGAEESGLLGAWHYVKNPVVPMERTVTAINHDGGLVAGARTDDVLAWGPEFSTVEGDVQWAAAETGLILEPEKSAPFGPAAGLLYRSDHYPFLISGVPAVYLMPGFTVDGDGERGREAWREYLATVHHAQADNFDGTAPYEMPMALTAMSVRLAWRLANADGMPQTHAAAPVRRERGAPNGWFFGDPAQGGVTAGRP